MILLNITVDNINTVLQVYNQVQIQRATEEFGTYTTVSGLGPITLLANVNTYTESDPDGLATNWYISRYYNTINSSASAWSDPVLGEAGDLYYNPLYPEELSLGTTEQLVIDRLRLLVGDPKGLNREYGTDAESSIHNDGQIYELDEKGWPASITMDGTQYTDTADPTVNGYRYLKFNGYIDTPLVTYSGTRLIEQGVDVWYYTFRWSDRELIEAYDNTPPPPPLTTSTANAEIYMLACAYDLLSGETWEVINEDGAKVADEGSKYDPSPGILARDDMLTKLRKRLDDAIKTLALGGITGVLID